jgi:hypothetical protein
MIASCYRLLHAAVTMHPAENGRGSRGSGNQHRAVGSATRQGSGQGSVFGRGGFPVGQGFNPGYACRGPFSGYIL